MIHSVKNVPVGYGPKKNFGNALNILTKNIIDSSSGDNIFINLNFLRVAYKLGGDYGWRQAIKANKLNVKDLNTRK